MTKQKKKTTKNNSFSLANVSNKTFTIILILIAALGLGYRYIGMPALEKRTYEKLDKQAYEYIQSLAQKYPGKVTHEKYCEYSSAKFSKGTLGCVIDTQLFITNINSLKEVEIKNYGTEEQKKLGWRVDFEDASNNASYNMTNIKRTVYVVDNLTCGIHYDYGGGAPSYTLDKTKFYISAGCSGNALREHYPVRQ